MCGNRNKKLVARDGKEVFACLASFPPSSPVDPPPLQLYNTKIIPPMLSCITPKLSHICQSQMYAPYYYTPNEKQIPISMHNAIPAFCIKNNMHQMSYH